MKKIVSTALGILVSITLLNACGTQESGFNLLAFDSESTATCDGQKAHKRPHGPPFLRDLTLTDAQKAEVKTILDASRPNKRMKHPNASARKAFHKAINEAFLLDSFDAAALATSLDALKPEDATQDHEAHHLERAKADLKIWGLLTSAQRSEAAAKATEEHPHGSPVDRLSAVLELTEAQKTALTSAFEANRPKRRDPVAFFELLNSESTTAADLAALHTPPEAGADHGPLNMLSAIHAVLTAEQRQVFVDKGLARGPHPRHRGPH